MRFWFRSELAVAEQQEALLRNQLPAGNPL